MGHLGRTAAAIALIAVLVVPAVASSMSGPVAPVASVTPSASLAAAPPAAATPQATLAPTPAPSFAQGFTNPPRRPPQLVFGEAASRGVTTGARPGLLPGSVNRTTMALSATYDVKASLNFGTRAFKASTTIQLRNDSGGPIDRLELNTIATRLGGMKLGAVTSAGPPPPSP